MRMVMKGSWNDERPWEKNDRIMETYITSPKKDLHGEVVDMDAIKSNMPWLVEEGFYEWQHTGFPIGKFLGWKEEDGKIKVKIGLHDSESSGFDKHDEIWEVIKNWYSEYGNYGQSSIKGITSEEHREGDTNFLDQVNCWAVGWVGNEAANPDAEVTLLNTAAKTLAKSKWAVNIRNHTEEKIKEALKNKDENMIKICNLFEEYIKSNSHTHPPNQKDGGVVKDKEEETLTETQKAEEEYVEEEPVEEPVAVDAPEESGDVEAKVDNLEDAVGRIATALEEIDSGTPEVVEDIAEAAVDAMNILDDTEVAEDDDGMTEMSKRLEKLEKAFSEILPVMEKMVNLQKKLSRPVSKSRRVQVQPTQKKAPVTKDDILAEYAKHV